MTADPLITIERVTDQTWHTVEPLAFRWLRSKHCPHTPAELWANMTAGDWTLYRVSAGREPIGLYAVRVFDTARGRGIEMPFLVGSHIRQWWQIADSHMEALAREFGAAKIVLTGRKGWARLTEGRYRVASVIIERTLQHG